MKSFFCKVFLVVFFLGMAGGGNCFCEDFTYKFVSSQQQKDSIIFSQKNDPLTFVYAFSSYCNTDDKNLKLEYSRSGNDITIQKIFDGTSVTRCVQDFAIEGTIHDLPSGEYTITFIGENRYIKRNAKPYLINKFSLSIPLDKHGLITATEIK